MEKRDSIDTTMDLEADSTGFDSTIGLDTTFSSATDSGKSNSKNFFISFEFLLTKITKKNKLKK